MEYVIVSEITLALHVLVCSYFKKILDINQLQPIVINSGVDVGNNQSNPVVVVTPPDNLAFQIAVRSIFGMVHDCQKGFNLNNHIYQKPTNKIRKYSRLLILFPQISNSLKRRRLVPHCGSMTKCYPTKQMLQYWYPIYIFDLTYF